jgi:hypothetical protein
VFMNSWVRRFSLSGRISSWARTRLLSLQVSAGGVALEGPSFCVVDFGSASSAFGSEIGLGWGDFFDVVYGRGWCDYYYH